MNTFTVRSADSLLNHKARAKSYAGRFAPSPTGKLHFGSLVAAVASFLDARSNQGLWLVRIEDIDPPREEAGAAENILACLKAHHLHWDGDILYQSKRLDAYSEHLQAFNKLVYPCSCNRKRLSKLGKHYDRRCLHFPPQHHQAQALRLRTDSPNTEARELSLQFHDIILGHQQFTNAHLGDFVIQRKDKRFAYQWAVAIDDIYQGITHIIRGSDLLDSTPKQRYLFKLLGHAPPHYGHLPLALGSDGCKLSKQTQATPIDNTSAALNLINALAFLGHTPPKSLSHDSPIDAILEWGIAHWNRENIPKMNKHIA